MRKYIIPIVSLLFSVGIYGQQSFTNNGGMQVHNGANMSAWGGFTNNSTSAFVNNGNLYIRANISNAQASMANSTGSLYLNGTSAQSINGTQTFRTYNLSTANSSGISLNNNLSIGGTHTFSSGMIVTSSTPNYLIYEAGSSYTGSSDSRHVNGWIRKIGSTSFVFPVGNANYLRQIAIGNLSASSTFDARYEGPTINTANRAAPIISVDPYEYWTVNRQSGGTAQITMNWDNSKVPFPLYSLPDIRAVQYTGGLWTDRGGSATGDITTTGSITSNTLSSFGPFTMGSLNSTLPLQFIKVTAKRTDSYSLVEWSTEQELNIDHFEIERRDNITNSFVKIGTAKPHNVLTPSSYQFKDDLPVQGNAYYRIKSVDTDGQIFYSNIAMVTDRSNNSYKINNPVTNAIYLQLSNPEKGNYQFEILSGLGQVLQHGSFNAESTTTVTIPLSSVISRGSYILRVRNSSTMIVEKIVVR